VEEQVVRLSVGEGAVRAGAGRVGELAAFNKLIKGTKQIAAILHAKED
jgi:hypothetical protein